MQPSPRITPINGHYRSVRGNNSEIVAVLIILGRPQQQVERQEIKSMPLKLAK